MFYAEDSFFTLGLGGRLGLSVISLLLCVGCIWFVFWFVEGMGRLVRVLIALVVFYLFVWLSPQIYYMFYLVIFDDLPLQWVVKTLPDWRRIGALMTFTERATLTEHGLGALWWVLAAVAISRRRPKTE